MSQAPCIFCGKGVDQIGDAPVWFCEPCKPPERRPVWGVMPAWWYLKAMTDSALREFIRQVTKLCVDGAAAAAHENTDMPPEWRPRWAELARQRAADFCEQQAMELHLDRSMGGMHPEAIQAEIERRLSAHRDRKGNKFEGLM